MFGRPPFHRSPWIDVAAVVFVLALFLAPLGYLALEMNLAMEMMGGPGGFGGGSGVVASGGGGSAYVAPGSGSSFSAWTQRQRRDAGTPLGGAGPFGGASVGRSRGATAPFSSSWRARAAPSLSGGEAPSSGGSVRGAATPFGTGIQSPGPTASYGDGRKASRNAETSDWTAEAQRFAGRAQALSRQLGQMDRDPVDRSLGEMAPSEGPSEGADRASGGASAAQTNNNPGTPPQPTLPIDDHVHWLVVAGLVWGVWKLK
jgi:hypothetical protein